MGSPSIYKKIAGNGLKGDYGISVLTTPDLEISFHELQKKARAGDYWANVIVKSIEGLTSSHFKPNVYVRQQDTSKLPEFILSVPAITVYFRKRDKGEYLIYKMEVSRSYFEAQKAFNRPALYKVVNERDSYVTDILKDGRLPNEKDSVVVVCDSAYRETEEAAFFAERAIKETDFSQHAKRHGFYMHFTPGAAGKIGGLKNMTQAAAPESSEELRESALLLTKTMIQARNIAGISWVSEGGGSGVLTQAMYMLQEQGINFTDSKHFVFFSELTTNLVKAQGVAQQLGMKFERKVKSIDYLNPSSFLGSGLGGAYVAAYYRYKSDPEKYTLLKMSADIVKEATTAKGATGVLITSSTAAGFALGYSPTAVGLAAGITAVTALAKSGLPKLYKKIADKF